MRRWVETRWVNPFVLLRWTEDQRVNEQLVVLARSGVIRDLLVKSSSALKFDSGFFRLGPVSLPKSVVQSSGAAVRELMARTDQARRRRARQLVEDLVDRPNRTRGLGQLLVLNYFFDEICGTRSAALHALTRRYVNESVVPDDIRHLGLTHYRNLRRMRLDLAVQMRKLDRGLGDPADLVEIALRATSDPDEAAEVYFRLVLSVVGFTGAALEWLLIDCGLYREQLNGSSDCYEFVRESLRLHSPACRLSREVDQAVDVGGTSLRPGDEVLLNIHAANRDPQAFNQPSTFLVERPRVERARELSFGKGVRSCPVQNEATGCMVAFAEALQGRRVQFKPQPFSRMIVGTLTVPPKGKLIVGPKVAL